MTAPKLSPALAAATRSAFGAWSASPFAQPVATPQSDDGPVVMLLASAAARRGQLTKAARLLCISLASHPRDREVALALALVLLQRDRPIEALALLDEVMSNNPNDLDAAGRRAFILGQLGRFDEACRLYDALLAAVPRHPGLLVARGRTHLALGHKAKAIADYRSAIDLDPGFGEAWIALSNIKTVAFSAEDVRRMDFLLARGDLAAKARIEVHFALGKALEDAGSYEQSFHHYRQGNSLQASGAFPLREAVSDHVERSINAIDPELFRRFEGAGSPSPAPIFIVGMPRSGTTLVEQILASHPSVEGAGELPAISVIASSLGEGLARSAFEYADLLQGLGPMRLRELGERYIDQVAPYRRTDRKFFVDKMPSNWMHLGLIRLILPKAKIVDVRREPLDCCFSNFAQYFPRGHQFSHSLEGVAAQYRDYRALIDHVDAVAPGMVVRLNYEELVDQPEASIAKLLEDLGLPFDSSCLRFFANDRPVQTPSAQQVRQPINRRGIGRWRPYEPWLAPLIGAVRSEGSPSAKSTL